MGLFKRKRKPDEETENLKAFLDMIAPSIVKFETGYYICGNTFRCIWALREYPTSTDDLAILRHLGEKHGVTLHIYTRMVSPLEERKIVHNAEIRNRMNRGSTQDMQRAVEAESNLQDVANLIGSLHRNKEPLLHCAVYIEMIAGDMQELQILQTNVEVELMRSKLNVDRLKLRQQAGFCAVSPVGFNAFGTEYERVLPASSVANLFPFNYSGKTDRKGFYIGKDKYGSNIVVDFDQRDEDKTSANVLILGNSGQGKSYLMKLLLLNFLEAGKSIITLDVEHEQWELCQALGGCFADIIEGTYKINLLEPRCWDTDADPYDVDAPKAFRQSTRLAQHTSFLKDVFRTYKDFTTAQIDTIEIMLTKLYTEWGITEETDFSQMRPEDYPILSELYDFIEIEYENFNAAAATVKVRGLNIHPGSAKNKMKNAALLLAEFIGLLPAAETPAHTEGYEGFFHLDAICGNVEEVTADYIIRDHNRQLFEQKKELFLSCADFLNRKYGEGTAIVDMKDSYYNMREIMEQHMHLIDNAKAAMEELGIEPKVSPIRGGTDGARLSFMGLPCPNLCTGGENYHGRYEYACVQSMEKTTGLLIAIAAKYADR